MRALLTGITGNLGYELSLDLIRRGSTVIPCVRGWRSDVLSFHPTKFERVVESDLTQEGHIAFEGDIDCIVHCAGDVHFRTAGDKNERMMRKVLELAERLGVPVYFVSTAFVYKQPDRGADFNNIYERDKYAAEQLLVASDIPYAIFRPSVLVGNSQTGEIRNFSGFYTVVKAFISAIGASRAQGRVLRFPRMLGESNMLPVDQAAESIGKAIEENQTGILYVTNPAPPRSQWVLDETLNFYDMHDSVAVMDISFQEFGTLDLTEEESALYQLSSHFNPYWSMDHAFPTSLCAKNLIDHDYLLRALSFFRTGNTPASTI